MEAVADPAGVDLRHEGRDVAELPRRVADDLLDRPVVDRSAGTAIAVADRNLVLTRPELFADLRRRSLPSPASSSMTSPHEGLLDRQTALHRSCASWSPGDSRRSPRAAADRTPAPMPPARSIPHPAARRPRPASASAGTPARGCRPSPAARHRRAPSAGSAAGSRSCGDRARPASRRSRRVSRRRAVVVADVQIEVAEREDDAVAHGAAAAAARNRLGAGPPAVVEVGDPELLDAVVIEGGQQLVRRRRRLSHWPRRSRRRSPCISFARRAVRGTMLLVTTYSSGPWSSPPIGPRPSSPGVFR